MIGGYDPMAMPAPPQLMIALLGLTFVLHISMLGLLFAALWTRAAIEWCPKGVYDSLRVHRAGVVGFSMVITMGIPPLLFIQVLYGRFFYSSSISIGFPWLAIIGYLLVGFYALYWAQWSWMKANQPSALGKLSWLISVLCVLAIGFTYSWNHLKSMSDTPWTNQVSYMAPMHRLVGYFGAALIGSSAWGAWLGGQWRKDRRTPRGASWAAMIGGLALLGWTLTSNGSSADGFRFDRPLLLIGAVLAIQSGVFLSFDKAKTAGRWLITASAPMGMLGLLVQREAYRLQTLAPYYSPFSEIVKTQWTAVALFAVTLVIGLIVIGWLFIQARRTAKMAPMSD